MEEKIRWDVMIRRNTLQYGTLIIKHYLNTNYMTNGFISLLFRVINMKMKSCVRPPNLHAPPTQWQSHTIAHNCPLNNKPKELWDEPKRTTTLEGTHHWHARTKDSGSHFGYTFQTGNNSTIHIYSPGNLYLELDYHENQDDLAHVKDTLE